MVNKIIGELLLIALMIAAAAALALAISPPSTKPAYEIKVEDAYPPTSSQELFNVIMVSGEIRYSNLKVRLINATTGDVVDTATYNGNLAGGVISAEIKDTDGYFSTGDFLRFKGSISPGIYRVIITDDRYVAFEGLLKIQ
ncbi:hypothetical protein Ferp_0454 [Ferroglobus placidus DSM 10642]|uniref:Archaeal Type IV pilin N-terminal domain-containing protein n=1 Tax=Ferroglobus placidus (strain DSM 10642 / AEDII12DO) TaxID=589924 RepID=D3S2Z6_FERPA|nr:hypothetical protein [Ferroglobus placidus]ADC64629.1 hypothetical protein Ferp_0454 [Ferroglobus placidus DSM 10642]